MPFRTLQEENEYLTWGTNQIAINKSAKDLPAKKTVPQIPELPKSTVQLEVITVAPKTVNTTTEVPLTLPSL